MCCFEALPRLRQPRGTFSAASASNPTASASNPSASSSASNPTASVLQLPRGILTNLIPFSGIY